MREFLSKQWRYGCARHHPGEFIEAELKSVGQLNVICARSLLGGECGLAQARLTIKDSCVLTVASSDKDLREVILRPQEPVHLQTRAPHDDALLEKDLQAGEEIKVTVDSSGVDVSLTCSSCVVLIGGSDG